MEIFMAVFLGAWVAAAGVFITVKLKRELRQLEEEEQKTNTLP